MSKTSLEKALEKQTKAQRKADRNAAIRTQAQNLVNGTYRTTTGFIVLDRDSEALLMNILEQYESYKEHAIEADKKPSQTIAFDTGNLSDDLISFYYVGIEALKLYGMLTEVKNYMTGAVITLSKRALSYENDKKIALDKENEEQRLRKLEIEQRQRNFDDINGNVAQANEELKKANKNLEAMNDNLLIANETLKAQLNTANKSLEELQKIFVSNEDGVSVEKFIAEELRKKGIDFKEKGVDVGANVVAGVITAAVETFLQSRGIIV